MRLSCYSNVTVVLLLWLTHCGLFQVVTARNVGVVSSECLIGGDGNESISGCDVRELVSSDQVDVTRDLYVFLTPASSLVHQQISLALEIWRRQIGNVLVVTTHGYLKPFHNQLKYMKRSSAADLQTSASSAPTSSILIWKAGDNIPLGLHYMWPENATLPLAKPSLNKWGLPVSPFKGKIDNYEALFEIAKRTLEAALNDQDPQLEETLCKDAQGDGKFFSYTEIPTSCDESYALEGAYGRQVELVVNLLRSSPRRLFILTGMDKRGEAFCEQHHFPYVLTLPTAALADHATEELIGYYHPSMMDRDGLVERFVDAIRGLHMKLFLHNSPFGKTLLVGKTSRAQTLVLASPFLSLPREMPPSVIFTGSVVVPEREDPKHLSPGTLAVLENTAFPVIYVAFGTHALLADRLIGILADALVPADMSWSVIWTLPERQRRVLQQETLARLQAIPGRLSVESWTEGPAVLAHPNVKVFVSHCGGNSLGEALRAGVPVIGVPTGAEQPWLCETARRNVEFVFCHHVPNLDADEIRTNVEYILYDTNKTAAQAAENMRLLSARIFSGALVAADWIQYAMGSSHRKGFTAQLLTKTQKNGIIGAAYLDIFGTLLLGVSVIAVIAAYNVGLKSSQLQIEQRERKAA